VGKFFDHHHSSGTVQTLPKECLGFGTLVLFPACEAEKFTPQRTPWTRSRSGGERAFWEEGREDTCGGIGQRIQKVDHRPLDNGNKVFPRNSVFEGQCFGQTPGEGFCPCGLRPFPESANRLSKGSQGQQKFLGRKPAKISCDQPVGSPSTEGLGFFKGADSAGTLKAIETAEP
jgi:hypothetical protein